MKRTVLVGCVTLAMVGAFAMSARADYDNDLCITGFWGSGTSVTIHAYDPHPELGWDHNTYGCGAFTWTLNGQTGGSPLYCLDVWHSFNWGQNWDVDILTIPPDPAPPYNTHEAAWIYHTYGKTLGAHDSRWAQGVQLALWEVCTEVDWRDHWSPTSWHSVGDEEQGDLYITSVNATALTNATTILTAVYNQDVFGYYAYYYRPSDTMHFGQGQMGDVPEPGVLMLLGVGLITAAGIAWRRRRNS